MGGTFDTYATAASIPEDDDIGMSMGNRVKLKDEIVVAPDYIYYYIGNGANRFELKKHVQIPSFSCLRFVYTKLNEFTLHQRSL